MPIAEIEPEITSPIPTAEVEAQLARVLASQLFRHSQRYPALLRFLVESACSPTGPHIKERLIGIEVFHRAPDYDTNTDPVVRVTAAEVRKRIAQYYQEPEHRGELRIDLPIGTYVPRFSRPPQSFVPPVSALTALDADLERTAEPAVEATSEEGADSGIVLASEDVLAPTVELLPAPELAQLARKPLAAWVMMMGAVCFGVLLTLGALWGHQALVRHREQAVRALWGPIASSGTPVLLVVGSHTVGAAGNALRAEQGVPANPGEPVLRVMNEYEQLPLSDVSSMLRLDALLAQQNQQYRVLGAGAVDLPELRGGPVVLFGGLDNRWTMRLSQQLRYRFLDNANDAMGTIADAQTPGRRWQVDFSQPYSRLTMDYAVVARYYDPMIEEPVMIVAGIGASGTEAASEFVTSERMMEDVNRLRPRSGTHDNMELVLAVQVVDGKAGPPHVVASQFW